MADLEFFKKKQISIETNNINRLGKNNSTILYKQL